MGGVIMLIAIVITVLLVVPPSWSFVAALLATLCTAALGLFDDAEKVIHERSLGLTPKGKLIGQFAIATLFTLYVVNWLGIAPTVQIPFLQPWNFGVLTTSIPCPICPDGSLDIPWLYLVFCYLLIIGMSNAVNLTDGLDGLAAGTVMVVMIVMAAIAYRENMLPMGRVRRHHGGRMRGLFVVQRVSRRHFHGRHGVARAGLGACLHRHHYENRSVLAHHRRSVRC